MTQLNTCDHVVLTIEFVGLVLGFGISDGPCHKMKFYCGKCDNNL